MKLVNLEFKQEAGAEKIDEISGLNSHEQYFPQTSLGSPSYASS